MQVAPLQEQTSLDYRFDAIRTSDDMIAQHWCAKNPCLRAHYSYRWLSARTRLHDGGGPHGREGLSALRPTGGFTFGHETTTISLRDIRPLSRRSRLCRQRP